MKKKKLKDDGRLVVPKKKPTTKLLKKKAWAQFSRFIRLRDSDENGICTCCSCGFKGHWKNGALNEKGKLIRFQAGHFSQGRYNSILFEERTVHSQCSGCNMKRNGALDEYAIFMIEKYGVEIIDELKRLKWTSVKFYDDDYIAIERKYKNLADIYERNKK